MSADPEVKPEDTVVDDSLFNARQKLFIQEYVIDHNATQAAIRAGYSHISAGEVGCQFLKQSKFQAAIAKVQAQRSARIGVTQDAVLYETSLLSNSCIDWYTIDDTGNVKVTEVAPEGAMRAIQSIDKSIKHNKDGSKTYNVKLKLWDKPSPLKLMGKHVGLFADKVEHTGPNGGPIELISEVKRTIVKAKPDGE